MPNEDERGTVTIDFSSQLAPTANAYDVQSFLNAWNAEPKTLEIRPPFQRNLVWTNEQRSYLVDTMLRGLPVPELYLQKRVSPDGEQLIIVVDGQQRISACIGFVNGDFSLVTSETTLDPRWAGKKFADLSPELRARFREFTFIGRQLPSDLDELALREVFQRLNRTVEALEAQELRHAAYTGDFIRIVERAAESLGLSELGVFSAKDIQRRRHDAFVSEIFHAVLLGMYPNKKDGLDELYMTYERQGLPQDDKLRLKERFGRVDDFLQAYGARLKKTRFRNKSDAYTLLTTLMLNAEKLPNSRDSQDGAEHLIDALEHFSAMVNAVKKAETSETPTAHLGSKDEVSNAAQYLHAVERAASDRLSRVRRAESMEKEIGELLAGSTVSTLGDADRLWFEGVLVEEATSDEDLDDLDAARRVLEEEGDD